MEFYLLLSIRGSQIPAVAALSGRRHNSQYRSLSPEKRTFMLTDIMFFDLRTSLADQKLMIQWYISIQIVLLFFHNSGRESNLFEVIDPILQSLVSSKIYVVIQQYIQAINIFTVEAIRKHALSQILSKHKIKASND